MLLPPSETKRAGGSGEPLAFDGLALPVLAPQREAVVASLVALSADPEEAARVLKLSERQRGAIADNAALRRAPTMPAADRYTGVLFDALDASSLDDASRAWLGTHALIHTAPFGPVGALDAIPAYRLAAGASLPGLPSMRRVWSEPTSAALAEVAPLVVDLRSEAYASLGPVPPGVPSTYVRVVTEGADGAVRALNHFNKKAKGELTRRLATDRPRLTTPADLVAWGRAAGLRLRPGARAGETELVV
nr:peroxide stress protein YaaA [Microbacterium sp. Marseille-Q6965]